MTNLTDLTLIQAAGALHAGDITSRALTQAYLERIETVDSQLHAYLQVDVDGALTQADQADQLLDARRKDGGDISPLMGIPVAIKDVLAVEGLRCTAGSKILETFEPPYDAAAVTRLKDAGMVILGKTNMDEFAMGSSTENSAYGVTHNPWDLSRVPGGSSGGSAAVVAAGLAPVALGTDTGGSIRQPASFCGITGLKPSYGRVSRYGLFAYGSSLDTVGVLGRSAADVAAVFSVIGGHDKRDATSSKRPMNNIQLAKNGTLSGVRIGLPDEYFDAQIQAEVKSAVREAITVLESLGAQIVPIQLPHTQFAVPVYYLIAPAEASANLARYDGIRYGPRQASTSLEELYLKTRGTLFGRETKRRIMLGTYALSAGYYDAYYGKAQKVRSLIQGDFKRAFKTVDLIAAPVAPSTAFEIGIHRGDPLSMYLEDIFTLPANLAGIPGIAFPVGHDSENLPIGMQLLGQHFQEQMLVEVAHAYQQHTSWHQHKPNLKW